MSKATTQSAGWATCDITPPLGLPMGGRGARFSPGKEILDPLLAQAVVLQDAQGQRVVFISVDLVEFPALLIKDVCNDIAAALGTTPPCVLINASHTHASPMMGLDRYATNQPCPPDLAAYNESLVPKLVKLAINAQASLREVTVTWHMGTSDIGINRRRMVDGKMAMKPNPAGPYDKSFWVLDIQSTSTPPQPDGQHTDGRCVLLSHACHPVLVYRFAWNAISAEWPGRCRQTVKALLGEHVHCQFFQALAGNIRPRAAVDSQGDGFRDGTPQDVIDTGDKLANDAVALLKTPGETLTLKLAVQQSWFIAHREPYEPLLHWETLSDSGYEHLRECGGYWSARLSPGGIPPFATTSAAVGLVRLADHYLIAWIGGEAVAQWRKVVEQALPGRHLAIWGYTQDNSGYLPVDAMLPQGGYEVVDAPRLGNQSPAPFKPGMDDACAQAFIQMARVMDC